MEQNFIENQLVILTKQTLDIFLKQANPSELIALYTFYYYTAKWQKTNQPKCTTDFVANGLHWNRTKVARVKKQLIDFGLIEDVRVIDNITKKVKGYYVKMNYVFKKETLQKASVLENHLVGFEYGKLQKASVLKTEGVAFEYTNALSTNNTNALSTDNKRKKERKEKKKPQNSTQSFDDIFEQPQEGKKQEVENLPLENHIQLNTKELNTNNIKKVSKKEKEINQKSQSFDDIIDAYTQNEDLRKELKEHLKTRKAKKGAMTNRAIELSLKKLDIHASDDLEKIQIVQNSIMNGWTSFFPLKEEQKREKEQPKYKNGRYAPTYNIEEYENEKNYWLDKFDKYSI